MKLQTELLLAVNAVHAATRVARHVLAKSLTAGDSRAKADRSPVTVADFACQAVISYFLSRDASTAADPIVGEEESAALRSDPALAGRVMDAIRHAVGDRPEAHGMRDDEWWDLIDRASAAKSTASAPTPARRYWTLDPIDGTKGFLRQQQFAVCLALLDAENQVQVGVLGCPHLPFPAGVDPPAVPGDSRESGSTLQWAVRGHGAFQANLNSLTTVPLTSVADLAALSTRLVTAKDTSRPVVLESYESSHSNHALSANVMRALGIDATRDSRRLDSQCKYAALARGDGHVYLRILGDPAYKEKIWDHASGVLLVEEAGGIVTDLFGEPLVFSPSGLLARNTGVVATSGPRELHQKVIDAVQKDDGFHAYVEAAEKAKKLKGNM
ncbi:3'(2'),5'-bisphosphate nucleotidase [Blastocladiella emersonii ATCC 22665]|nr:3'(2'),5'-bisphosphate nucleotidase [Blastocladiella emersonii ATCC 22665]